MGHSNQVVLVSWTALWHSDCPHLLRTTSQHGNINSRSAETSSSQLPWRHYGTPLICIMYAERHLRKSGRPFPEQDSLRRRNFPPLLWGHFSTLRTAGTFPVPSFGHHSIGPQRGTGRGIFIGIDLGPAIHLGAVGPEAPGHKVPRRLAGLSSLPWFPGVLLPFLCQAIKDYKQSGMLFLKGHERQFYKGHLSQPPITKIN